MTQSNSTLSNAELSEFVRVHNAAIAHQRESETVDCRWVTWDSNPEPAD